MKLGVLLLDDRGRPRFADRRASVLLGASGAGELEEAWPQLEPPLEAILSRAREHPGEPVAGTLSPPAASGGRGASLAAEVVAVGPGQGFVLLLRDRSPEDPLERDLRQASRSRAIAGFLPGLAHEVRAPLNSMALNLELLKRSVAAADDDEPLAERRQRYAEIVEAEVQRLHERLERLLRAALPSREEGETTDLAALVEEVAQVAAPGARKARIELEVERPEGPLVVTAPRRELAQAILQVVANATEAVEKAGGGRLALRLTAEASGAKLSVNDTGAGMPRELRDRAFDLHVAGEGRGPGTGLYVARSIVELYGGRLSVARSTAGGTEVILELPRTDREPTP